MQSDDALRRAKARGHWPLRVFRLGDEPAADLRTTPEARVASVWELTVESWLLAGRSVPSYARDRMPIRVRSLNDAMDP